MEVELRRAENEEGALGRRVDEMRRAVESMSEEVGAQASFYFVHANLPWAY